LEEEVADNQYSIRLGWIEAWDESIGKDDTSDLSWHEWDI
jgi:hypothetical protein